MNNEKRYELLSAASNYSLRISNGFKNQIHYEYLLSKMIYIYHK